MFESVHGVPPDGIGCSGLDLVFLTGLEPDYSFTTRVLDHFRELRGLGGQPLLLAQGLADEIDEIHAALLLKHGASGGASDMAFIAAALAAALARRLGGECATLSLDCSPGRARIGFDPGDGFVHCFALLYSVSFMHYFWREGSVEARLDQLLEVAELFFAQDAGDMALDELPGLDQVFPQETLNSFVNLVHPPPRQIANMLTKILLLEDNRELGEIIADMLSSCGYVVCQAPDGLSGLSRLERERYQLILSDIQMPRLNGMGLLKVMRNLHLDIPVILTTGFTGIWQEEQVLQQGAVAFLPKPFGMMELIRVVDQALAGQSALHSR